jgi:hypothetical protein
VRQRIGEKRSPPYPGERAFARIPRRNRNRGIAGQSIPVSVSTYGKFQYFFPSGVRYLKEVMFYSGSNLGAFFLSLGELFGTTFCALFGINRPISPSESRPAKLVGYRSFLSSIQPTVSFRQTPKNSHIQIR